MAINAFHEKPKYLRNVIPKIYCIRYFLSNLYEEELRKKLTYVFVINTFLHVTKTTWHKFFFFMSNFCPTTLITLTVVIIIKQKPTEFVHILFIRDVIKIYCEVRAMKKTSSIPVEQHHCIEKNNLRI